jgi:hypothetical protein
MNSTVWQEVLEQLKKGKPAVRLDHILKTNRKCEKNSKKETDIDFRDAMLMSRFSP